MNNDLISRSELKKAFEDYEAYSDIFPKTVYDIIDNAPTVDTYTIEDIKEVQENSLILGAKLAQRPQGEWIVTAEDNHGVHRICCPFCSYEKGSNNTDTIIVTFTNFPKFCENCGAELKGGAV